MNYMVLLFDEGERVKMGVYDEAFLLGISPVTPLHMGMGRAGGVVDLPVQRDSLGLPIIYASSLKGAFKSFLWAEDRGLARCLFGPEPNEDEKYASPVSFLDAVLALIPVREASGGLVMATSPLSLGRVDDYLELMGAVKGGVEGFSESIRGVVEKASGLGRGKALAAGWSPEGSLFVGGRRFEVKACGECGLEWLGGLVVGSLARYSGRVLVFSEEDFRDIVEGALIRLTRVRVERERKTVKKGGLWTEEYVPQGSLFVSAALCSSRRASGAPACGGRYGEYLGTLRGVRFLVVGGNESTGKGVVRLSWVGVGGE